MIKNQALVPLFEELKEIIIPYSKYFNSVENTDSAYGLSSKGDFLINDIKKDELYFVGLMIQKSYVGFYFMPIYYYPEMKLSYKLLRLLKGKSCFYIKKIDDELISDMIDALELGIKMFKEKGWL